MLFFVQQMEENMKGNRRENAPSLLAGAYVSGPWAFFGSHKVGATW
jgi:hypothetical protein